jgi:hypothetical protein
LQDYLVNLFKRGILSFIILFIARCLSTYETASTRKFYHGRTETVRSCTLESLNLAKALTAKTNPHSKEVHQLLYKPIDRTILFYNWSFNINTRAQIPRKFYNWYARNHDRNHASTLAPNHIQNYICPEISPVRVSPHHGEGRVDPNTQYKKTVTGFEYPRACRFRKYQIENRSWELRLPTFFKN